MTCRLACIAICVLGGLLAPAAADARTVRVADASAPPGETGVAITVEVDDASGITGGDLTLTYDRTILTAKAVRASSLLTSNGITVVPNVATAGTVRISMAGVSGIPSGGGALLTIEFDVASGAAPGDYGMALTQITLRDVQGSPIVLAQVASGTFEIVAEDSGPSDGLEVHMSDLSVAPGDTGIVVTVEVRNPVGIAGGDVVILYDSAVLSPKRVAGSPDLTGAGITLVPNMDVAGRISVSLAGATGVGADAEIAIRLTFDVKSNASPGSYRLSFERLRLRDERAEEVPVKSTAGGAITVTGAGPLPEGAVIRIDDATGDAGDTGIPVDIIVENAAGLTGGDLTLSYDAGALTATSVRPGDLATAAGITVVGNTAVDGRITISMAGASGLVTASGTLLTVTFDIAGDALVGTYEIGLDRAVLRDQNATQLAISRFVNGDFLVDGGSPDDRVGPVALDLDTATGDQGQRQSSFMPRAGDLVPIQILAIEDALGTLGVEVVLAYDSTEVQFREFKLSPDIYADALVIPFGRAGEITIGIALKADATGSQGAGTIGVVQFEVLEGFSGETRVVAASASYAMVGGKSPIDIGGGGDTVTLGGNVPTEPSPDFDGDGKVDFNDFVSFARAFGSRRGEGGFDTRYDLDTDNTIGFGDFVIFAQSFGKPV